MQMVYFVLGTICIHIYYMWIAMNRELGSSWSYGSWIYIYLCNLCLSPLTLWVRISLNRYVLDPTLCNKVCQWLVASRWFPPVSSTMRCNCNIVESGIKHHKPINPLLHNRDNTYTYILHVNCYVPRTIS